MAEKQYPVFLNDVEFKRISRLAEEQNIDVQELMRMALIDGFLRMESGQGELVKQIVGNVELI